MLDLGQLDAMTAQLDLLVGPDQQLQLSVVARLIVPLAPRHTPSTDHQLAHHPGWHHLQTIVDDVTTSVGYGPTDAGKRIGIDDPFDRRPHRRLGRTVEIPDLVGDSKEVGGKIRAQCLAAAQDSQAADRTKTGIEEHPPCRWRRLDNAITGLTDDVPQSPTIGGNVTRDEVDPRPYDKGQEQ